MMEGTHGWHMEKQQFQAEAAEEAKCQALWPSRPSRWQTFFRLRKDRKSMKTIEGSEFLYEMSRAKHLMIAVIDIAGVVNWWSLVVWRGRKDVWGQEFQVGRPFVECAVPAPSRSGLRVWIRLPVPMCANSPLI